ncbi:serine/threonine protein kinase [Lujinxingia litoralis]|nr:serine/threonine-protein kinase [Lujinxingia litoralis]
MAICPNCKTQAERAFEPCTRCTGYFVIEDVEHASHPDDRLLGREIGGRFIVAAILGSGSMGYVYKAYQAQVDRMVALKIFHSDKVEGTLMGQRSADTSAPGSRDRFAQEARVLAKLSHPNCVTLYDFGVSADGNFLYIAMEYVAGVSLRKAVRRGLKNDAILEIARQMLMALREAHTLDIVHRDLKPENIILSYRRSTDEQIVKVLDFGIAKLLQQETDQARTAAGLLFGTPAYMSPEQCRGESEICPATDIYALGCMLFEMTCGGLPYISNSPQDMVRMHQHAPLPEFKPRSGLKVPPGLETFVRTCMAKLPGDRYADAHVALAAFERLVGQGSPQALQVPFPEASTRRRRVTVPENRISGEPIELTLQPPFEGAKAEAPPERALSMERALPHAALTATSHGQGAPRHQRSGVSTLLESNRTLVFIALSAVMLFSLLLLTYIYLSASS